MISETMACQWQSARFYRLLDESDYEGLIALFAPDGRWHRQGVWLQGAEDIRAALAKRPTNVSIRHLMTAVDVIPVDAHIIDVFGNVLVFRGQGDLSAGPLQMPASPSTLMTVRDRYRHIDGKWCLEEKSGRRIFVTAPAPAGAI